MLQIKNISKRYKTGDLVQIALDNVSLNLRDNEFVAILGPSGSGKTTLLNIIGGLDTYDKGDLIIDNVSTSRYKDRDWDAYRNHSIGFVFQSYNLIPHQTLLANVELALTIGGIKKAERKARALEALDKVGLKEQSHKKPNQLSGGQMQRVAIARALVNNPKILLADEPTGALDTATSIQVMELLKEVAKDRLVVMVTHNPELANTYANRIVKLKDGHIIDDTNPYIVNEESAVKHKRLGKASMSIFTAFSLSFNNLLTKITRTLLTSFAGSIGIIGIALILSLSTGFQNYIDKIQEDTLSSYPLQITSETADTTSMILSMVSGNKEASTSDSVVEKQYMTSMFSAIGANDLKSFKKFLESDNEVIRNNVSSIRYQYSITPQIYTIDSTDKIVKVNPSDMLSSIYSSSVTNLYSSMGGIFNEVQDNIVDKVKDDYDVLAGRWPSNYDEIIIVLSEPNSISDLLVYSLGLRDTSELKSMMTDLMSGKEVESKNEPLEFTYDELLNLDYRLINTSDLYRYNEKYDLYEDMSNDKGYMQEVYDKSLKLKVVGIVCQNENASSMVLTPGVTFFKSLTDHVIEVAKNTEIVKKQLSNEKIDVFSGKRFDDKNQEEKNTLDFQDMITVDENVLKEAFKFDVTDKSFIDEQELVKLVTTLSGKANTNILVNTPIYKDKFVNIIRFETQGIFNFYTKEYTEPLCSEYIDENNRKAGCTFNPDDPSTYDLIEGEKVGKKLGTEVSVKENDLNAVKENYYKSQDYIDAISPYKDNILTKDVITSLTKAFVNKIFDQSINTVKSAPVYADADYINSMVINMAISMMNLDTILATPEIDEGLNALTANFVNNYYISEVLGESMKSTMEMLFTSMGKGNLFSFDTDKFAQAFKFDLNQDELSRLMESALSKTDEKSFKGNLLSLGYQDIEDPTSISIYFKDFESKENFIEELKKYNDSVEEDKVIRYTDITGILMSSVKKIVDSVTYVLIAFVSISLIVSSIMIGIITYISVLERTKEIGILRAIGASKGNISSIFNAETFIVGLISGLMGVGITMLLNIPINNIIHSLTDNYNINAVLPTEGAITLVILSVILTLIGGIIPSKAASKKDPVIALRTE